MSVNLLLANLIERYPQLSENINLCQLQHTTSIEGCLAQLASQIPSLSFRHVQLMCQNQEKLVLHKIKEIKQVDLYDEIASINPTLNFKTLTMEEVSSKISHLKPEPFTEHLMETESSFSQEQVDQDCESSMQENLMIKIEAADDRSKDEDRMTEEDCEGDEEMGSNQNQQTVQGIKQEEGMEKEEEMDIQFDFGSYKHKLEDYGAQELKNILDEEEQRGAWWQETKIFQFS